MRGSSFSGLALPRFLDHLLCLRPSTAASAPPVTSSKCLLSLTHTLLFALATCWLGINQCLVSSITNGCTFSRSGIQCIMPAAMSFASVTSCDLDCCTSCLFVKHSDGHSRMHACMYSVCASCLPRCATAGLTPSDFLRTLRPSRGTSSQVSSIRTDDC